MRGNIFYKCTKKPPQKPEAALVEMNQPKSTNQTLSLCLPSKVYWRLAFVFLFFDLRFVLNRFLFLGAAFSPPPFLNWIFPKPTNS